MKNNIKLLLLSLLIPLLCIGSSFAVNVGGNAGTWVATLNLCNNSSDLNNVGNYDLLCFRLDNGSDFQNIGNITVFNQSNWSVAFGVQSPNGLVMTPFCFFTNGVNNFYVNSSLNNNGYQDCNAGINPSQYYFNVYGYSLGGGNSSCESDLSSCQNALVSLEKTTVDCFSGYNQLKTEYNALSGNYANCLDAKNILSGSLASCNSDLSSCSNSCDTLVSQCLSDKENAISSYSGCLETNSSLQNYNDSLSSQLQECLEAGTGGSGGTYIALYDLFRTDNNVNYSLPIENNIWLPAGYRGFIDEGVLSIKRVSTLESAYNIDDEDFTDNVVGNFGVVFLFFMSSGFFLVFIYAIRRYFIGLKSIK